MPQRHRLLERQLRKHLAGAPGPELERLLEERSTTPTNNKTRAGSASSAPWSCHPTSSSIATATWRGRRTASWRRFSNASAPSTATAWPPGAPTTAFGTGTSAAGRVYYSRRWGKKMLGYEEAEIGDGSSPSWMERVHVDDDDLPRLQADINALLHRELENLSSEFRVRHRDGQYRWMLCRGISVMDPEHDTLRAAGSLTNITDRKVAEEQLRFSRRCTTRSPASRTRQPARGPPVAQPGLQQPRPAAPVRPPLHRSRRVQGDQRQPRPSDRRQAAHRGVTPPGGLRAQGRHHRPDPGRSRGARRRGRVRDAARGPGGVGGRAAGGRSDPRVVGRALQPGRARSGRPGEHRDRHQRRRLLPPRGGAARRGHRALPGQAGGQGLHLDVRSADASAGHGALVDGDRAPPRHRPRRVRSCTTSRSSTATGGSPRSRRWCAGVTPRARW